MDYTFFAPRKVFAKQLSKQVDSAIYSTNARLKEVGKQPLENLFTAARKPPISIKNYLARFMKFIDNAPQNIYIIMLIYLQNCLEAQPKIYLTEYTVHRLLATCLLLAYKFSLDSPFSDTVFAKVAGLEIEEMKKLEVYLLKLLDYKLFVTEEAFEQTQKVVCTFNPW
ncbi:MAG: cyclin [Tatlockia sp.]|jgi:hypothetical protein